MAGTIAPSPWFTGLDDNGVTVIGGKLYTYAAGTSTPLATYTDVNLQIANPNPTVLDGGGRATLFLEPSSYKFVLKDEHDVTIRTQDNIAATAPFNVDLDIAGIAGENLPAGSVVYLSDGTGPGTTAGRWYLADADFAYASSDPEVMGMVQTSVLEGGVGSFRLLGRTTVTGPLVPGQTYYVSTVAGGLVTPAPVLPAFTRLVGIADSLTTIVTATSLGTSQVIGGDLNVTGTLSVSGAVAFGQTLTVGGDTRIDGILRVGGGVLEFSDDTSITRNTLDGADNGVVFLCGGGGPYSRRGAFVGVSGNEENSLAAPGGTALIHSGIPNGQIRFGAGGNGDLANLVGVVHPSGTLVWGGSITADAGLPNFIVIALPGVTIGFGQTWTRMRDGLIELANAEATIKDVLGFINPNGVVGRIQTSGTSTIYATTSDARLKQDCGLATTTDVLTRTRVHDFDWTAGGRGRGVFAQEAVEVLPVAVSVGTDEVDAQGRLQQAWGTDYSRYVPDLIVGWQQHEARILSLLERLERLESRHDG